jgi:preprotein translocase subunit SecA
MRKVYFHNDKSIDQNINTRRLSEAQHVSEKQVVDINKLLNRVKIDQKNETKRKIIFYSFTILGLSLLGTLITVLK